MSKSIIETHPEIVKQWHPIKNGDLKPENYTFGSGQKIWWLCEKKCQKGCPHEWEAIINNRCGIKKGNCPYCLERPRKICKHMSISETHSNIIKMWHPTKNNDLTPEMFSSGSGKKIWWLCDKKCPEGCLHEWEATIANISNEKSGCPFCSTPRKKSCKHMSIVETNPEITKQWHPTKNGDLTPESFTSGSNQKVWWLCDKKCPKGCSHEWETKINDRCGIKETDCPYCCYPVLKICKHMSITETHPDIAKQWHPTKNNDLTPEMFSSGSGKKIWWLCDKKCPEGCLHEWETDIQHRTSRESDCPYCCESPKILCEHTSIVKTHPDIAKKWHPIKNKDLKPEMFSFGSGVKVWWLCDKKCPEGCLHEWETKILDRCGNKESDCPYCCEPRKKLCEHTSIIETHPEITKQWHSKKNGDLKPEMFSYGSNMKVWWLCDKENKKESLHEWKTEINTRCGYMKSGCPFCINKTEEKLRIYLSNKFKDTIFQYKDTWCKYDTDKNYFYRFDFMIESLKIIIELDGNQHFKDVKIWENASYVQERDVLKMKRALDHGFTIIRLLQEDVWNNNDNWLDNHLLSNLIYNENPKIIYIEKGDLYINHKKMMKDSD